MTSRGDLTAANQARKETAEFHHKAVLVLGQRGWTTCAIAECLGITQRRVQLLVQQPCEALEVERKGTRKREARENYARTKQHKAPFDVEAFLEGNEGGVLNPEEMTWIGEWKVLPTREKVRRYLRDRKASQAQIARLLGRSRSTVSEHVKSLLAAV